MLYYCEIEFVNSQGQIETRSFSHAYSVVFNCDGIVIKGSDAQHFLLREISRINYLEFGTLASRLSSRDRDDLFREAGALTAEGQRIQAIKLVRSVLGWGLKESKDYVDTHFPRVPPKPVDYGEIPF